MPNRKASVLHGEIRELVRQYARELALDGIYPIGSIYICVNNMNPSSFLGGTWELLTGNFFIGSSDLGTPGNISGNNSYKLDPNQIPSLNITKTNKDLTGSVSGLYLFYTDNPARTGVMNFESTSAPGVQTSGTHKNITKFSVDINHEHTYENNSQQNINIAPKRLPCYIWKRVS